MTVEDVKKRNIQSVLREASRLFSQVGVERTSMGQVADCAGVTRRSVLNYFDSKNDLITAVQQEYIRSGSARLEAYFRSEEHTAACGLEQYLGILHFVLYSLREQYPMANNLTEMSSILRRDPELDRRGDLSQVLSLISSQLEPAYNKGLADGSICGGCSVRAQDTTLVTLLLRGLYRQLAYVMEQGKSEDIAFADKMIEDFVELNRRILTTPAPDGEDT